MGLADKLAAKTKDLGTQGAAQGTSAAPPAARTPRTGPGQMLVVRTAMAESSAEIQQLREQLEAYADSAPAKKLDPAEVGFSKYANRHDAEFQSKEFLELRAEIERAGRNVQPILVRRVTGRGKIKYEVIFGHRRHRSCLDLTLPVWAVIIEASDEELFVLMDMENRQRKNPSPFELGDSYRRALEAGLFNSIRQLAGKLHVDHSLAAKAYAIATLPPEVLGAFENPTVIQYRWGQLISDALQKDPNGVSARAKELQLKRDLAPVQVLQALTGTVQVGAKRDLQVAASGKPAGTFAVDKKGAVTVQLRPGVLSPERAVKLEKLVLAFLREE
jgi:ParB family transcriptional regulator, chromosome partitioning protein